MINWIFNILKYFYKIKIIVFRSMLLF